MNVKPDAVLAPSLVVVGSANVDLTAFVDRLPTAGETVAGGRLSRDLGGKGCQPGRRGGQAGRSGPDGWGAVGADADGAWMRDELGHAGVDTADLRTVAAPTGTALIVVGADAENQIAVCPGANELVSLEGVAVGPDEAVLLQLEIAMVRRRERRRPRRGVRRRSTPPPHSPFPTRCSSGWICSS
ncbi:PfkB family carbohydrate kinase [Microbacterium sp. NRRL B-14842]|uniref:PfkB family carbohydrate kinase n=1 Tax=Microbacterium sp. NRRL B-14842 TaxID=3162881 RepID=UPI003D27BF82